MTNAVILSNQNIYVVIRIFLNAREKFQIGNSRPVAVNFIEAMTNRQRRQLNQLKFSVALNVSDLPPRRVENRNVDVD